MKKLFAAIALTALLAPSAFAQETPRHAGTEADGSMAMHDQRMASMQEHMRKMRALMEEIRTEQDPERRQQLMQQHMQAMQAGMRSMHESMSMPSRSENGEQGMMGSMDMGPCMRQMKDRSAMMQEMMEQMQEHQAQQDRMRKRVHGK